MTTIELRVGGQSFSISCPEGQEEHVQALGAAIDEKFQPMAPQFAQNLLFASLQLADELHEARKATRMANADKKVIADSFDAYRAEMQDRQRDADTALGQRDQLKAKIAELEEELGRMQSAQQSASEETAGIRQELTDLREKELGWEAEENTLRARIADLEQQRAEAQEARSRTPPEDTLRQALGGAPSGQDEADLPPALERFAQLLEETADKLEARGA
ncbi:cell division protein ZapA [Altererythrobacter sp. MTPC7]|uniref:cell division protein ZapA n=1 Tax=Altererythrobacter sp. MTPC7 TaxID=3056567 RepID=UPI0036F28F6C